MSYRTKEGLECYKELTIKEVAEIYNVDRKTIEYYGKKFEVKFTKPVRKTQCDSIKIEDILNHINDGLLLGEIAQLYGVNRNALSRKVKAHGYNFRNHEGQTRKQSEMMKTIMNPTLGTMRPDSVKLAISKATKERLAKNRGDMSDYKKYSKTARSIAYSLYKEGKEIPDGMVIDHIFSIKDCFDNGISVEQCSHKNNLRLISDSENLKKGAKSLISLDEFLELTK